MTQHFLRHPGIGGICTRCDHDLQTRRDGFVYCTNLSCIHHAKTPHPTGKVLNCPKRFQTPG